MIPLQNYSHYSILDSILKPSQIIDVAVDNYLSAAAITDNTSMAGIVQFWRAAKKTGVKPIIGVTFEMIQGSIVILAMNHEGYRSLMRILSDVNKPENYFKSSLLSMDILRRHDTTNLLCLNGHYRSSIYNILCPEDVADDYFQEDLYKHIDELIDVFPKGNFYLQVDGSYDSDITDFYLSVAAKYGIKISSGDQMKYATNPSSSYLFDVMRALRVKNKMSNLDPMTIDLSYTRYEEHEGINKEIADRIDEYDILEKPKLPQFDCPNGISSIEHLTQLCREGYKDKVQDKSDMRYIDRIKYELKIFKETGLSDYFLILADVIKFAENDGQLIGPGRGSASGCLISYLISITKIDPIKYGLLFNRFYNEGRKGSMPDIDVDFPKYGREKNIQYTIDKYGKDNVGQIATYQTFMGRAAIKSILRAEGKTSFQEMNEITKGIEDKAKISDELQDMKDAGREPSVLLWALENKPKKLSKWVRLEDDNSLSGDMAVQFQHAINFEGIKAAQSRHAAGLIISNQPICESSPTLYDPNSKKQIVGLENEDAEALGLIKYDYLGISTLDRMQDINEI